LKRLISMKKQTFDAEKKSDAFLRWYEESQIKTKDIDTLRKMYSDYQYKEWLKLNPIKQYTDEEKLKLDEDLKKVIIKELQHLSSIGIEEYMVEHKWKEIKDFHIEHKTTPEEVEEVRRLMWSPKGRSDYRRIEPELLLTTDDADIQHTDFWGKTGYRQKVVDNKFLKHWNILRVFISSSRHDGAIGRQLHYLVRDKRTQTYLGILCIQSSLRNIKPRNDYLFGGLFDKDKELRIIELKNSLEIFDELTQISNQPDKITKKFQLKKLKDLQTEKDKIYKESRRIYKKVFGSGASARQLHMANGQTIMGTQPFSRTFNGGKLLALLCLSDQVAKDWQTRFGEKLVTVETTSLYGEKEQTQYDGLKPFWINLGEKTSGVTVIKPSNDVYDHIKRWMKRRDPKSYFRHLREKNINGQNAVRETKNQLITKTYQRLKIKDVVNVYTNHKRGVYVSKLYENAELFLQYKIQEKDLIPQKFDTSVNELVNFWKFGFQGDSKKSKNQKLLDIANNKIKHSNKNSPAKVRLQYLIDKAKENNQSHIIEHLPTDWYGQMQQLTMVESKKLYLSGVGR
jgi:hypothetical protein